MEDIFKLEQPLFAPSQTPTVDDSQDKGKQKEKEKEEEKPKDVPKEVKPLESEQKPSPISDADQETGGKCVICWSEEKTMLFLPCKHLCSCKNCSDRTTECPLCRQPIESKTHVYV